MVFLSLVFCNNTKKAGISSKKDANDVKLMKTITFRMHNYAAM